MCRIAGGLFAWLLVTGQPAASQEPKSVATFGGHTALVRSVAVTADGKTLATSSDDHTVRIWDVATGKELLTIRGHTDSVTSVAFSPNGKIVASGSHDNVVRLWDVATGRETAVLKPEYHVFRVAFTPDGKSLISAGEGSILFWDPETGKQRSALKLVMAKNNANLVLALAISGDGQLLATGHGDGSVVVWNPATGEPRTIVPPSGKKSSAAVVSAAFSPDGKTLVGGFDAGTVKFWDVATGKELVGLEAHRGRAWSVALSPDGKLLATGGWDGTVKVWDATTQKQLAAFAAHADEQGGRCYTVAFTADGKTLISGGGVVAKSGEAKLWRVDDVLKSGAGK